MPGLGERYYSFHESMIVANSSEAPWRRPHGMLKKAVTDLENKVL